MVTSYVYVLRRPIHNLNFVKNVEVKSVNESRNFYGFLKCIYVFSEYSVDKWTIFTEALDFKVPQLFYGFNPGRAFSLSSQTPKHLITFCYQTVDHLKKRETTNFEKIIARFARYCTCNCLKPKYNMCKNSTSKPKTA